MVSESRSKENRTPTGAARAQGASALEASSLHRSRTRKSSLPVPKRIGNFEIKSVIASGGMGMVYYGQHAFLGKPAAVKVLRPDLPRRKELVEMLRGEAQALARVDHPNVVQVIDIGQHEGTDFIAMDFAPGMDLRRWLSRNGPFEPRIVLLVAWQVMSGIAAAHLQGVLHRDIKPDNIILARDGALKITDFGLAGDIRMVAAGHQKQNHATPAYAAPEVLKGWRSDHRSDVFSIAATLYQAATGLLPFGSASRTAVLEAQRKGVQPLHELVPALPKSFCDAVMAALSVDDAKRPSDAAEFMRLAFPQGVPSIARARRRWWIGASAAALVAVASLAVWKPWDAGSSSIILPPPADAVGASTDPDPSLPSTLDTQLETAAISRLVQSARERRARREWTALIESLGTETVGRLDDTTMQTISEFARRFDGSDAASEARPVLARGFANVTARLQSALVAAQEAPNHSAALAILDAAEATAKLVGFAPDAAWRDAVNETVTQATLRDRAYIEAQLGEADRFRPERRFFDSLLILRALVDRPEYDAATDEVRAEVERRVVHAEAGARAVYAEGEATAITVRAESFRSRAAWAATSLSALELAFRATAAANPANLDAELRKRMSEAPAPDRFAFLSTLTMLRRASDALEWLAQRLESRRGDSVALLLVGRDGAVAKRVTVGILGRSGLFLEVSGLGGLPRAELPVWELDSENWRVEIERLPADERTHPNTLLANLHTFRAENAAANALAPLIPTDASHVCEWRRPIEPIADHLKTIAALAAASVGNRLPPPNSLPESQLRYVEAHLSFVSDFGAEGSSPVVAAASFAYAMTGAPSAYLDPRLLAKALDLLPAAEHLARALLDHVPTDPTALKHLFGRIGEDRLPSDRREEWREALFAATKAYPGDKDLWELAKKLKGE